jgi:hypothetical protein
MFLATLLWSLLALQICALPGSWDYGDGCTSPPPNPEFSLQNYQEKFAWFVRFADAFMYPNNTIEAAKINSTLFAETVQGRVDATTTFDGRELNTEVAPPTRLR